jgi:hypothetical protein
MADFFIHIDRGIIDSNRKHGRDDPPVTIRRGKHGRSVKAHHVKLPAGAEVIYDGSQLLGCGARCVIRSPAMPEVVR